MKKLLLAGLALSLVSGCASSGPLYQEVKTSGALAPKAGMGLAVIYMHPVLGVQASLRFYVNNQELPMKIRTGSFYTYDAVPGPASFATAAFSGNKGEDMATGALQAGAIGLAINSVAGGKHKQMTLEVAPNQIYYVEIKSGTWGPVVEQVPEEEAQNVITRCHWRNQ